MHIRIKSLMLFLFVALYSPSQVSAAEPYAIVKEVADQLLSHIQLQQDSTEQLYGLLDELLMPHFNFSIMSKLILGKVWNDASDLQRTQFIEQFKVRLLQTYAHALLEHTDREIVYLPAEKSSRPNIAIVKTEIRSDHGQPLPIHYRMYNEGNQWKVIDVSIHDVSLVLTYRNAFAAVIKKDGLDMLIKQLTEKNDAKGGNVTKIAE